MEGLKKNEWAQACHTSTESVLLCLGDCSLAVLYNLTRGGGTQAFSVPNYVCVCALMCRPSFWRTLFLHKGGHPRIHLASGPLGYFPMWRDVPHRHLHCPHVVLGVMQYAYPLASMGQ